MFVSLLKGGSLALGLGAATLVAVSLMAPPRDVDVAAADEPVVAVVDMVGEDAPAAPAVDEPAVVAVVTPEADTPVTGLPTVDQSASALEAVPDTAPAPVPTIATIDASPDMPGVTSAPALVASADRALVGATARAPQVPASDVNLVIRSTPSEPSPLPSSESEVVANAPNVGAEPTAPEAGEGETSNVAASTIETDVPSAGAPDQVVAPDATDVAIALPEPVESAPLEQVAVTLVDVQTTEPEINDAAAVPSDVSTPDASLIVSAEPQLIEPDTSNPETPGLLPVEPAPQPDAIAAAPELIEVATTDSPTADMPELSLESPLSVEVAGLSTPAEEGRPIVDPVAPEQLVQAQSTETPPSVEPETDESDAGASDIPNVVTIYDREPGAELPQGTSKVRVNRYIGADSDTAEPEISADEEAANVDPNATALERYAADYTRPDDAPMMAIIILDDTVRSDAADDLAALGMPVTVVIDATKPDAAARMKLYRDAGVEVALNSALPAGATATDAAINLEAAFDIAPETVALVDIDGTNLQANRDVAIQAVGILSEEGRGLIVADVGLNPALRAASDAGVPAAALFRDLDGQGQDARVISRFLDQAAFRARQADDVILLARLRSETLDALRAWSAGNRAAQISIAPVSAVLKAQ